MKIISFLIAGLFMIPILVFMFTIDLITLNWDFDIEKDLFDDWFDILEGVFF